MLVVDSRIPRMSSHVKKKLEIVHCYFNRVKNNTYFTRNGRCMQLFVCLGFRELSSQKLPQRVSTSEKRLNYNGHRIHVASIIGASIIGHGIAGVSPEVTLDFLKVCTVALL